MTDERVPYDPVAERLAELVRELRAAGHYPPALEAEVQAHHERVVRRAPDAALAAIAEARHAIANRDPRPFSVPIVAPTSSKLGGTAIHKAITPTVTRHLQEVVEQLNEFATSLLTHLALIGDALAALGVPRTDLTSQLDATQEQLARIARTLAEAGNAADD